MFPNEFENHANLLLFFCVVTIYMLICFIRAIITSFAFSMNNKRFLCSKGATKAGAEGIHVFGINGSKLRSAEVKFTQ